MKAEVLIDYLTFSVKGYDNDPVAVIIDVLGLDPDLFQELGYGIQRYNSVLVFGNIQVRYDPREDENFKDLGICVNMSGNGCRLFESMSALTLPGVDKSSQSVAFAALFQELASDPRYNVSRIDVACDDRGEALDINEIISKVQAKEYNSRSTKRQIVQSWEDDSHTGATVYIGAPSSDFRIRMYDKAAQRHEEGHWVRVEMVLRGENANAFVSQIVNYDCVGQLAAHILNDKFRFIVRDDVNISRCSVCDWWADFVQELESVRLVAREVVEHTIDQVADWFRRQIGASLNMLYACKGDAWLNDLLGSVSLNKKQSALVTDYWHVRGASA